MWISGRVLSGLRHTANLCGEQGRDGGEAELCLEDRGDVFSCFLYFVHFSSPTDLFQGTGGPHQLVDHVDRDPHEG